MRFTVLAALALLTLAASAAAAPSVATDVGLGGIVRPGSALSVRVVVENPGPAWSGSYRLEETIDGRTSVSWEWPLEVPARGRKVRFFTLTPVALGQVGRSGLRGGLSDQGPLQDLNYRFIRAGSGSFVVLALTDRGTGFSAVRDALDPPGANQGSIQVQLPAMAPEFAPREPAAWAAVDAIVIDVDVADRIDAATWTAIRIRVAQGASLVVQGAERLPELFPSEMVPGRPAAGAGPGRWIEPAAAVEHSAFSLELSPGATRPSLQDEFLPWAATRRFASGRVTVAALDLRNLRSPTEKQAPLWSELLGLPAPGQLEAIRPLGSAPEEVQEDPMARPSLGSGSLVVLLGVTAIACLAALVVVRRHRQAEELMRWAPLLGIVAALPLLGVGAVSRLLEDRTPLLIEEHVEVLGLTRTTTVLSPPASRDRVRSLSLDGWPPRLLPRGNVPPPSMDLRFRGGPDPKALGLRPAQLPGLSVLSERWDEGDSPFRLELGPDESAVVRNVSEHDLIQVHALDHSMMLELGDVAAGEAVVLTGRQAGYSGSPAINALRGAAGRLQGLGVAGVVEDRSAGILGRPTAIVLVSWLEKTP